MSIESEITDLQKNLDAQRTQLANGQRALDLLQNSLKIGFLDTLKFVIEEGLLPDLMKRLGFGQESEEKADELVEVAKNPLVFEDVVKK